MDDYIRREKALQFRLTVNVSRDANSVTVARGVADAIAEYIKAIPAADVRPVKKGRWIIHRSDIFPADGTMECDQCHEEQPLTCDDNFCPNCGADMREEQHG